MFFTRSSYAGQTTRDGKRMHGRGIYTLADGSKYVGAFHDGTFHGHGIIFFTPSAGGGQFRGAWNLGECLGGDYVFDDGLEFTSDDWVYTTDRDRRFWHEYLSFIKPEGKGGRDISGTKGVITPDYSTSDGVPPSLADGKPQFADDVSDAFWATAPLPRPEHEGVAQIVGTSEDIAVAIAESRDKGLRSRPKLPVSRAAVAAVSGMGEQAPPGVATAEVVGGAQVSEGGFLVSREEYTPITASVMGTAAEVVGSVVDSVVGGFEL